MTEQWTACFSTYDGQLTDFHITNQKHGSLLPVCGSGVSITDELRKWTSEELIHHGNLIAAAPDLVEALELIEHWNDSSTAQNKRRGAGGKSEPIFKKCSAARAKAGRSIA